MTKIMSANADTLYSELLNKMLVSARGEEGRNGPVLTMREPTMFGLYNIRERIVHNPVRDCNPFFHIMETVWMLAGRRDAEPLLNFNKGYSDYANGGIVMGAYGHRWRRWWADDQLDTVINRLRADRKDRQVVLQMWSPIPDLTMNDHKDRPCNTSCMFREWGGRLHMTITNRSNDLIWGALGANVVHFTYLQEMIARAVGLGLGNYYVVSNNLHIYKEIPKFKELMGVHGRTAPDVSPGCTMPILREDEDYKDLLTDCEGLMNNLGDASEEYETMWVEKVAKPTMMAYMDKPSRLGWVKNVEDEGWKFNMLRWMERRGQ